MPAGFAPSDPFPDDRLVAARPTAAGSKSDRWWTAAVFYHILVDRFRRGGAEEPTGDPLQPEFCGGNLQGVTERLDYLRELGVTALWLSPIHCTAAYHGYHVTNYEAVEPRFGGLPAFQALLKAAKPGFRIILDWVPNHVHCTHPFFLEARRSRRSRYRDWFFFDRQGRYRCFLEVTELPKLNLDHPEARRYMIQCALRWLDFGVDGLRLDHVLGPSLDFWREFYSAIKQRHPAAFLVGEAFFEGIKRSCLKTLALPHKTAYSREYRRGKVVTAAVMREYVGVFDGLLDFEFRRLLKRHVARARAQPSPRAVQARLEAHYASFPAGFCLPSFLDNHDVNRFLFEARGQQARLRQAARIQFRQSQPPVIYYGTEAGLTQTRAIQGDYGDLQARAMMPWLNPDPELLRFYTHLIWERRQKRASC